MRPDTVLVLGDFEFARYEIPEKISFGGDQLLVTHQLIGGNRVIDAMGRSDAPLAWAGIFQGETAMARARYLDGLRIAGKTLALTWAGFIYDVVIASFLADYERAYQIPYRISCIVLQDRSRPITTIADPGIDSAIGDDMGAAGTLGDSIGDSVLSGLLGTLDTAIKGVSSFANAAQSTINSVLVPLAAVQSRVSLLVSATGNTLSNVSTLGGILPNTPIAQQAAKLNGQAAAMTQAPKLYNLQSVLGRMGGNLGSIGAGQKSVTTAGGNLFSISANEYGDATAWTTLAKANKITDPQLSGINTVVVPTAADKSSGGVLSA